MSSNSSEKTILSLLIKSETDVVLARKRARQVALLLGFDAADQTRVSTAVSEVARNAFVHASGGRLDFKLQDSRLPYTFLIEVLDKGAGIENVDAVLSGELPFLGLRGASKLVDKFAVDSNSSGTKVRMEKKLAPRLPFTSSELDGIANSLTKMMLTNPADEVYQQNQELLLALEELSQTKAQLDTVNSELKLSNADLLKLNNEMRELNTSLEAKVEERTAEFQQLNEELLAARDEAILANELKTQFVANVSHEIRTPMAGILGLAEWLTMSEIQGEPKELSEHILSSAQHLLSIVNDILDFSKLSAGKIVLKQQEFYLSSIFDEVLQSVYVQAKKKNIEISDAVDTSASGRFLGDSQRLKQIVLNLAHNAVKFTESGCVQINAKTKHENEHTAIVRIEVKDEGIGISSKNQERLFEPFVQVDGSNTRRYGGTGLGLAISRNIVELMNGEIGCNSAPGEGSLFYIELPLKRATQSL